MNQAIRQRLTPLLESSRDRILVIGIDGPTAAGKTILADTLAKEIEKDSGRSCFLYRLDWHLEAREKRVQDLAHLVQKNALFPLEGELHMRLEPFGKFLRAVRIFNEKLEEGSEGQEKLTLENLYSREAGGTLTGRQDCALKPGLVVIAEGHYTLRSVFANRIDLNLLLLGSKEELLARKIARVQGYRGSKEAEDYFWRVDLPSFHHHLKRFGRNADLVLDNTDYRQPAVHSTVFIGEWLEKNRSTMAPEPGPSAEMPEPVFSASLLAGENLKEAFRAALQFLLQWDRHIGEFLRINIDDMKEDLMRLTERLLKELNEKFTGTAHHFSIDHANALYNAYSRRLPVTLGIRIEGEKPLALLADVFHDALRIQVCWEGGYSRFQIERELGKIAPEEGATFSDTLAGARMKNQTPATLGVSDPKAPLTVITPTLFTIPSFLKSFPIEPVFSGLEEENMSASQALTELADHGGVWIHRFAKFSELQFFHDILLEIGGNAVRAGNYLIAVLSDREDLLQAFKQFRAGWEARLTDEAFDRDDEGGLDQIVEEERKGLSRFIEKNCPDFSVFDGYLHCSKISHDVKAWERIIGQIACMLSSPHRLVRKRATQFIQKHFPEISLETKKLWDDLPCEARPAISLDALTSISPSILAEIYLWLSLREEKGAILGANIYDIRKNSADCLAFLKAAAKSETAVVLQGSLNALGQKENERGEESHGYLKPKNGSVDLVEAALTAARDMVLVSGKIPPLFGIGLDHVDWRQDRPKGRARRFLQQALATESVTHFVLDGSALFEAEERSKKELAASFEKIADFAVDLLEGKTESYIYDREVCTGELNYFGKEKKAMIPTSEEMALFARLFKKKMRAAGLGALNTRPSLFIGNLGTTHHGSDSEEPAVANAKIWREALKKEGFVSPVLHGTTGTHPQVLSDAAEGCHKINVAGDFLDTFIKALPAAFQKEMTAGPEEPKKKMADVRKALGSLSVAEHDHLRESLQTHCRRLIDSIQSPRLSPLDVKYFRYKNYKFSERQVRAICEAVLEQIREYAGVALEKPADPQAGFHFSASMIEVPFDEKYRELTQALWEEGIRHFHIDVGDGKFISRAFSGLEKTAYLRRHFPEAVLHCHLMAENPLFAEGETPSLIEQYVKAGCNGVAIHARSFSKEKFFAAALKQIQGLGARAGVIIETSATLDTDFEKLIEETGLDWVVVMGVPVGFGGQIFDMSTLKRIAWFHQYAISKAKPFLIEVDGGLTMENISLCRRFGAQIFSGWSIVKADAVEGVRRKIGQIKKRIA